MVIRVTKPAFNLREKLSELDLPVGTHGSQIMKSNTISETAKLVGADRKNIIINGDFRVNQRGGTKTYGASVTGYHIDQWYFHNGTNGTYIASVSSAAPSPSVQTPHYLVLDCTAADTSIGTNQYASITYGVEGYNAQQTMWGTPYAKPLTLSFYHRHTATGVYSGVVRNASANFNYVFEYEQSSKDAWEKAVIHIKPEGTQAYNATNGKAFSFTFSMADNTYMSETIGQWFSGTYYHASNRQTNFFNSTNNFMRFAAVQLEVGSDATPFEQCSYGEQLSLCQRYFAVWPPRSGGTPAWPVYTGGSQASAYIWIPHTMRVVPTPTDAGTGTSTTTGYAYNNNGQGVTTRYANGSSPTLSCGGDATNGQYALKMDFGSYSSGGHEADVASWNGASPGIFLSAEL